ncbi:hypothetical protein UCRPC4_g00278 [Phaeomoniella chlamydospora]|uniref:CCD97-like C-terminal domain-containing protein n=1 Tax=Phaeomoniella chlamydospora TaxID=158046 RepID=A0A0G2F4A3_PHACM|nr:hypothetical protein UCRPC4_g00278 [Phaeomoniella chlamydospora]
MAECGDSGPMKMGKSTESDIGPPPPPTPPSPTRVRNRRKRYLDLHSEYFSDPSLELADPLLYDRLIRRFQTPKERESEGRAKGYSGILQADIMRSEAKLAALRQPKSMTMFTYKRGENGEIFAEEKDEVPITKEDGQRRWKWEMELRFLRGDDEDFDYKAVDESDQWDDWDTERRESLEQWLSNEEPEWITADGTKGVEMELKGETGIQDF